jgi:ankyrin repeat protein
LLFALLLPALASAGAYEDMEEALISADTPWAIQLINRGMDVNSVDAAGNTLLMQAVQRDNMDFFDLSAQASRPAQYPQPQRRDRAEPGGLPGQAAVS